MTIIEAIKLLCTEAAPDWNFQFEDRQLMNVKADNAKFPLIFFEEYREGRYNVKYQNSKTTVVELYFCKICQMHNDGMEREKLREEIEQEAVIPFIQAFKNHPEIFDDIEEFRFFTPPPRFDANDVSIMLRFNAILRSCL